MLIAMCSRSKSRAWSNRDLTFSELEELLKHDVKTPETLEQYKALDDNKKGAVKDVGGLIGGYLAAGKNSRRTENIVGADIIALDADTAAADLPARIAELPYNYILYTTRSHTVEKPRYRLIFPLSRTVNPVEYKHIICGVAQDLGVSNFCGCSYKSNQVMYYPSYSTDQTPPQHYSETSKEPLNVDDWLKKEVDWGLFKGITAQDGIKCADPRDNDGLWGAFCRKYTVTDALETFLSQYYEPTDDPTRWGIIGGTTPGLILYDNLLAYSHHAEHDIAADGHCHSAYDLVCLHIHKGNNAAMCSWIKKELPDVLREDAHAAFDDWLEIEETNIRKAQLQCNKKGHVLASLPNALYILTQSSVLAGIAYNTLQSCASVKSPLPWRSDCGQWLDRDEALLCNYLCRTYGVTFSLAMLRIALEEVFKDRQYNPLQDKLDSLQWDGIPRVDTLFIDRLSTPDTIYNRLITRKWIAACIQRAYRPGCKYDAMLILTGPQGQGKSELLMRLGMGYTTESIIVSDIENGKKALEKMRGYWIAELKELTGLRKASEEALKSFLSTTKDDCRYAYARTTETRSRLMVFAGTTNDNAILTDPTGNRRYWILPTGTGTGIFEFKADQIWAEAKATLLDEPLYLANDDDAQREDYYVIDEWESAIRSWLDPDNHAPGDLRDLAKARTRITIQEVWMSVLGKGLADLDLNTSRRIGRILRRITGLPGRCIQGKRYFYL